MTLSVDALPAEILLKIFSFCTYTDLVKTVPHVCARWQDVWRDRQVWKHVIYRPTKYTNRRTIGELLHMCPRLRAVDFSRRCIKGDIIQSLSDCCSGVERICMSCNSYYDMNQLVYCPMFDHVTVLVLTEKGCPRITLQYISSYFPNLQHFECHVRYFTKNDLVFFLVSLQDQLHTLGLRCITSDGFCILPYLSLCSHLKTLSLRHVCPGLSPQQVPREMVPHLQNITSLALENSSTNITIFCLTNFEFFPNVKELHLHYYLRPIPDIFDQVAVNFPAVEKLSFRYCYNLEMDTCEYLQHFERLTSLSITHNDEITDDHVLLLKDIRELRDLEFYNCEKLTTDALIISCSFEKLQFLKFDFRYCVPCHLEERHVKNKSLQMIFYRFKDVKRLEPLKRSHIRVCVLRERLETLGNSVLL